MVDIASAHASGAFLGLESDFDIDDALFFGSSVSSHLAEPVSMSGFLDDDHNRFDRALLGANQGVYSDKTIDPQVLSEFPPGMNPALGQLESPGYGPNTVAFGFNASLDCSTQQHLMGTDGQSFQASGMENSTPLQIGI